MPGPVGLGAGGPRSVVTWSDLPLVGFRAQQPADPAALAPVHQRPGRRIRVGSSRIRATQGERRGAPVAQAPRQPADRGRTGGGRRRCRARGGSCAFQIRLVPGAMPSCWRTMTKGGSIAPVGHPAPLQDAPLDPLPGTITSRTRHGTMATVHVRPAGVGRRIGRYLEMLWRSDTRRGAGPPIPNQACVGAGSASGVVTSSVA